VGIGQYGITVLDHANGMATFAAGDKRAVVVAYPGALGVKGHTPSATFSAAQQGVPSSTILSISRYAALHRHPYEARDLIRDGVHSALSTVSSLVPPAIGLPATVEVDFASPDMAEQAICLRGVRRLSSRTVSLTDEDPLRLYQSFIALVFLTHSLVETY
jgi:D-aminopeptidase